MRIVLLGPPGAGKGTQAKRMAQTFQMVHLSSGDILRSEKASGSELGQKLAQYMDAGQLVPDDVVVGVMAKAITSVGDGGLLLDGFPRTTAQAKALDEQLASANAPLELVVVFEVDEGRIVERICGRRSCPNCGEAYHVTFLPPKNDNLCDKCGTALIQRDDDKEAVVRERLASYRRQTEPLIDYYKNDGAVEMVVIDGNKSPDEVTADVVAGVRAFEGRA